MLCLLAGIFTSAWAGLSLTPQQVEWIAQRGGKPLSVAFDPYSGMDSFVLRKQRMGFIHLLMDDIRAQTGLQLVDSGARGWDEAYTGFVQGHSDILYGANVTPERQKIMRFTAPALRYPYVVLARKNSPIQTLGDINGKRIGFIASDIVLEALPQAYPKIQFSPVIVKDQAQALPDLIAGKIDAFVTSGGGTEIEYVVAYPELAVVARLEAVTSDMTLAVGVDQEPLAQILETYLRQRADHIASMAQTARSLYNRKALKLTDAELDWLEKGHRAVVGVAEDYLPFDYQSGGQYRGIAGAVLQEIATAVGFELQVVSAPFASLMDEAKAGRVHLVNMAKTEERQADFIFPTPFSRERDIVIGKRSSAPLADIYALENARVAVIEGFWHAEYLRQNLRNPRIVQTKDIRESLRKVRDGEADYLIENPTVSDYYIHGLGYQDLVKRGDTSGDSFLYFGVSRTQPQLASILDKVIPTLPYEQIKYRAIQGIPAVANETQQRLAGLALLLTAALAAIVVVTAVIARRLTKERLKNHFLLEREQLLYTDALTACFNRNHFNDHAESLAGSMVLPAAVVVVDLNYLKRANDGHGHAAGDALLRQMAAVLRAQWPQGRCFRMGGDEFMVLLDAVAPESLPQAVAELHARCDRSPVRLASGEVLPLSAAVGFALRQQASTTLDQCMAQADQHMYAAKAGQKKRHTDTAQ